MSYLFDTDIVSNPLKKAPSVQLLQRLATVPPEEQFTSAITVGEMTYGALRSGRAVELLGRLAADVWPNLQILPFDFAAGEAYGRLRADLEASGTPLAEPDMRIAAIALSRNLVLITGNVKHFGRISTLQVENWL